jgi:hypothetical protein
MSSKFRVLLDKYLFLPNEAQWEFTFICLNSQLTKNSLIFQYSTHPAGAVIWRLRAGRKRLIELSDCLLVARCRGNIPSVDALGIVGVIFFYRMFF